MTMWIYLAITRKRGNELNVVVMKNDVMRSKYLTEYDDEYLISMYNAPIIDPLVCGTGTLRGLKEWCKKRGYLLTVLASRKTYTDDVFMKVYQVGEVPGEWDNLVVSVDDVVPASKLLRVRVDGHFVPNTLPDLSVDVLNAHVRYAEDAYRVAIKSVEEDLEFMRKQCSELRHYTRCQIKDFTKHTPAEIETMLNKMNINDRGVLNACDDLRSGRDRVMGIIRLNELFRTCGNDNYAIRTCNSFCENFDDDVTYAEVGALGYCSMKNCLIYSFEKCDDYMRNNKRSDEFSDGC